MNMSKTLDLPNLHHYLVSNGRAVTQKAVNCSRIASSFGCCPPLVCNNVVARITVNFNIVRYCEKRASHLVIPHRYRKCCCNVTETFKCKAQNSLDAFMRLFQKPYDRVV